MQAQLRGAELAGPRPAASSVCNQCTRDVESFPFFLIFYRWGAVRYRPGSLLRALYPFTPGQAVGLSHLGEEFEQEGVIPCGALESCAQGVFVFDGSRKIEREAS